MAPDGGLSVSFPRYIVLLVSLRLSMSAEDFHALIFDLGVFRASKGHSRRSRDSQEVSPPSRYVRFHRSQNSFLSLLYSAL